MEEEEEEAQEEEVEEKGEKAEEVEEEDTSTQPSQDLSLIPSVLTRALLLAAGSD